MGSSKERHFIHSFDIDDYLNRFVPRPRFYILPKSVSHWFGYRPPRQGDAKLNGPPTSVLHTWLFSFLGAFVGISIIENVFLRLPRLDNVPVPIVIASFGAAAILEYNAIQSPLSQPRNLLLGHCISAAVGVAITKLFYLLPYDRFVELQWLAGALSVGAASTIMSMTKTVHPPAGATALLAATNKEVLELGWWLILLVLLAGVLMLASAMLVNNLYSRFPVYWWTPVDLAQTKKPEIVRVTDTEGGKAETSSSNGSTSDRDHKGSIDGHLGRKASDVPHTEHNEGSPPRRGEDEPQTRSSSEKRIVIEGGSVIIPDWMQLSTWETQVLEEFQKKLRE